MKVNQLPVSLSCSRSLCLRLSLYRPSPSLSHHLCFLSIFFFNNFSLLLLYLFCPSQVKSLQSICKQFLKRDVLKMSKVECISFLRTKLGIPEDFKKIFAKIWGASGKKNYSLYPLKYKSVQTRTVPSQVKQ